jgi:hypothetical protein
MSRIGWFPYEYAIYRIYFTHKKPGRTINLNLLFVDIETESSEPEIPLFFPKVVRNALRDIFDSPRKRGDFRRHLKILCLIAERGSIRSAGNGHPKIPRQYVRELQDRLGVRLLEDSTVIADD